MSAQPEYRGEETNIVTLEPSVRADQKRRLIALTTDPILTRAVQELAGSGISVRVVTSLDQLTSEILQHTDAVALLDVAALESPATDVVDALRRQLPDLRLMVSGHGSDQQLLATRISSQAVFRFVHKPASPQRLKLFMDAAARPGDSRSTAEPTPQSIANPAASSSGQGGGSFPVKFAAMGAGGLVVVVLAAWLLWPSSKNKEAATAAVPANAAPAAQSAASALLAKANQAFAANKFVASDGSSAAELFRSALKADPASREASEGFAKSIDEALRRAEESLLAGRLIEAGNVAAAVQLIDPKNPRLAFLNTQISRELARANADASQRQVLEARQAQIRGELDTMKEKVRSGALIEPAASSAVAYFRKAEAVNANDPAVRNARETLVAALLTSADTQIGARRFNEARRLLDTAGQVNSSAPGLDVTRRRLDEAIARQSAPEPAPQVARAEPPPAPAPQVVAAPPAEPAPAPAAPVAAAPAKPADEVISATRLKILHREEPVFPSWALQQGVSGWVEMEFSVAKDGSVQDIVITNAQPKSTFNSAATRALSRYRYSPVIKDGVAVAQRARIRMTFTVEDK